jgi:predicted AlkP superfamily pyrophosphatase or phosphodiesterase
VHDSDVPDDIRCERLMSDIQNQRIDFAYCSLGRLDALMHANGNDDPGIGKLMHWYDDKIRAILDAAAENYQEVSWYVFTDHGMHNVTEGYDLIADIQNLGLEWNKDYVAFYDSTQARIWFLDEKARGPIIEALINHPKGRILPEAELKELGIWFEDGMYGDLVFLMNSNIQMVPSFMGVKQLKGMHGYHPSDADSFASISSNRALPADLTKIHHIHKLMLSELELN